MKKQILLALACSILAGCQLRGGDGTEGSSGPEYEMTTYYVGFLYRGESWTPEETPEIEQLQRDHLANIERLAETGKLLLAGPFTADTDLRGMFVFAVDSMEEARALCDSDPMVQAGRLRVDLRPWYSAKGIHIDRGSNQHG